VDAVQRSVAEAPVVARRSTAAIARRVLLHAGSLLVGVAAYVAHEHFALHGASGASMASLVAAGGFGLSPVRAILHEVFAIEGRLLHLAHGLGGLALVGLTLGGAVSGGPLLSHAALAPFAIMGAAQAMMHANNPRNAQQAAALRTFATSLPEVEQFTSSRDLTSPANVQRAVVVLTDLVGKAQALGETELQADPGFQSALRQVTTRVGLSLGLDAIDRAINALAANPAAASAVPDLRKRLAAARKTVGG
jgi:hypothetical protein